MCIRDRYRMAWCWILQFSFHKELLYNIIITKSIAICSCKILKYYGAFRTIFHPLEKEMKIILSFNLCAPPCQNSKIEGLRQYPPHRSGRLIFFLSLSYFRIVFLYSFSSTERLATILLCFEIIETMRLSTGRMEK